MHLTRDQHGGRNCALRGKRGTNVREGLSLSLFFSLLSLSTTGPAVTLKVRNLERRYVCRRLLASKQSIEGLINRTRTVSVVLENHARVDPLVAETKAWNWNQFRPSVLRRRVMMSALPKSRNAKLFPQQRSISISC